MSDLVDAYDSGLLSSYGGGNVDWWQDYIRAELGRAHDFYAPEIERLTEANAALMAERASLIETKREQIERLTAELAETKRLSLADRAVISAQKQQLDRLVKGDKSPVAHALQMQVNALTAERDAALAKLAQYEQALGKLDGDSLDAMMEVIGEGEQFAWYNKGKSAMRDWFLRRISRLIARPEVTK